MARGRHSKQEVEKVLAFAETIGWTVEERHNGHVWGRLYCPERSRSGCVMSIHSTPKVPEHHARRLRRDIEKCQHIEDVKGTDQMGIEPEGADNI